MNALTARVHSIGARAWVRFVQVLNVIAASLLGGVAVVSQVYPGVISGAVGKLPPALGIPVIIGFGVLVHYALRRAKTV